MSARQIILVSGLSGSGKSVALRALEDAGYYSVDNLPAPMIAALVDQLGSQEKVAIAVDVRAGESIAALPAMIAALRERSFDCRVIFLESSDEALSRRFAETRRPHPLSSVVTGGVEACIREERRRLTVVSELGHRMDTSAINANTLRAWIKEWLALDESKLSIAFQSFGFKHGVPIDADFVFDARFLPNPYYDPALRALTGKDAPVIAFLQADPNVMAFVTDIAAFLTRWLPQFVRDHRRAVTIAIGCTGGQHRSVYIVDALAAVFGESHQTLTRHRDMPR